MSGVIRSIPGPTIRSCQERRDVSVMGVSFRVVLSFRFRVEGPFAAPLPEREGVAIALRAGGQIEHRAIERCSIVVGPFDEPGFLDEAAQLYEMAGAFRSEALSGGTEWFSTLKSRLSPYRIKNK